MLATALHYSHQLLKEIIQPNDHLIDATVGNGHDTLFLARLVKGSGHIYGFDVQEKAIHHTQEKLLAENLDKRVTLFQQGHETLATALPSDIQIKGAIFNLGYLPKSDKTIITQAETTLTAVQAILERLLPTGRIILVVYYGHPGGEQEKQAVLNFVRELPQAHYNVLNYQFINQKNSPPFLLVIEKKATKKRVLE
ncbi:class I SAM-dependent methyltransferase [Vagococcus entomophilus]|uniref:16S rRNA (Cytosine(1402)-N(4))-methyltransferase n=1 Tax=Vagococcus entomophilus TaxID=1160095 RepID=A0A430AG88_9ENTE|nr:class I SAM-dependent methyltransferase [Vagococcus entomophilus]RSU06925.1 16S rRNA (cytosine(1402)-N(4))-methyltransferase [Vagococcus entomophilus]